jgi:hypothetical protein
MAQVNIVFVGYHYKHLRVHDEHNKSLYTQSYDTRASQPLGYAPHKQELRARAPIQILKIWDSFLYTYKVQVV